MAVETKQTLRCDGCDKEIPDGQQLYVRLRDQTSVAADVVAHSYRCVGLWAAKRHAAHHEAVRANLATHVEQAAQSVQTNRAEATALTAEYQSLEQWSLDGGVPTGDPIEDEHRAQVLATGPARFYALHAAADEIETAGAQFGAQLAAHEEGH